MTVTNSSGSTISSGITAVALSYSRFESDWKTARRGDVMQMYGALLSSANRCSTSSSYAGPHTTFVQVDENAGTNWLDANWVSNSSGTKVVGEHAVSISEMMKWMACSSSNGFTVYRIN